MTDEENRPTAQYLPRRKFMIGLGALATVATLTACKKDDEQPRITVEDSLRYIETFAPDDDFLTETAGDILPLTDRAASATHLGKVGKTTTHYKDFLPPFNQLQISVRQDIPLIGSFAPLATGDDHITYESKTTSVKIDVNPEKSWLELSHEEKIASLKHELAHVIQIMLAQREAHSLARIDPQGIRKSQLVKDQPAEEVDKLVFSLYFDALYRSPDATRLELVPYIVSNLHYQQLPEVGKSTFQEGSPALLHHYQFQKAFVDLINPNTTVEDLVNSDRYRVYREEVLRK